MLGIQSRNRIWKREKKIHICTTSINEHAQVTSDRHHRIVFCVETAFISLQIPQLKQKRQKKNRQKRQLFTILTPDSFPRKKSFFSNIPGKFREIL